MIHHINCLVVYIVFEYVVEIGDDHLDHHLLVLLHSWMNVSFVIGVGFTDAHNYVIYLAANVHLTVDGIGVFVHYLGVI